MHLAASYPCLPDLLRSLDQPIATAESTALVVAGVCLPVRITARPDHLSGAWYVSNSFHACPQLTQWSVPAQDHK